LYQALEVRRRRRHPADLDTVEHFVRREVGGHARREITLRGTIEGKHGDAMAAHDEAFRDGLQQSLRATHAWMKRR
jgi:hypothetical protein